MSKSIFSKSLKYFHGVFVVLGAVVLVLVFFLVLPVMQTINKPPSADMLVQSIDIANVPPPPPPPQEKQQEEEEPEEITPELTEKAPPLELSQLELVLNPGMGGGEGWLSGDFAVKLNNVSSGSAKEIEELFSIADLDQKPRVIYQPSPRISKEMRKKAPGEVYIIFVVDKDGRVIDPMIQKSSDPIFEKPALDAVKQWKFDPGKRNGQAVRFRMRVPVSFPKGL